MIVTKVTYFRAASGSGARALSAFALTLAFLVSATARADVRLGEQFTTPAQQGPVGLVPGKEGLGWRHPGQPDDASGPVFLDYPADLSGAVRGRISFDLKRLEGNADRPNTVFTLQGDDGVNLYIFQVDWGSGSPSDGAFVLLKGNPFWVNGVGLWKRKIRLDRQVAPGQWVRFDLVWDDGEGRYHLYLDGRPQDVAHTPVTAPGGLVYPDDRLRQNLVWEEEGTGPIFFARPFSWFLDRTSLVRVGANFHGEMEEVSSPLTSAVLDNFEIVTNDITAITSLSHDGFQRAGYSGKLVPGQSFTVNLTAEPGGTAAFDIIQPGVFRGASTRPDEVRISGVPMTEDPARPGTYTATYTVQYGDFAEGGRVVGRFTDSLGFKARPLSSVRPIEIDGTTHIAVNASNTLVPADESARSGLTVVATDANGRAVRGRELKLTMSTTDEYTGLVGGGTIEDLVGGELDVDWGGITDSFGEVTAQYRSGFAAKTILVSARDMVSGDVGVGFVRSFIEGSVDIVVKPPRASALSVSGSMDVSLSRDWLTADGVSRSRITAVLEDASGDPLTGHSVQFTLLGDNGAIRVVQGRTDSRGRAFADYIAGTLMGQVQVEVRDLTSGLTAIVSIELRPDAPAEIVLAADPAEIVTGGQSTVTATVTDANGNPNRNVDVLYGISTGEGLLSSDTVATDEEGSGSVTFTAGDSPGLVTVKGTVISREPTTEEVSAAKGAVFLYGLAEDPGRLDVIEWLVKPGDEVVEGQALVTLEDRAGTVYTVAAPRDGIVATFTAEERDQVYYGDTLGYVLEVAE